MVLDNEKFQERIENVRKKPSRETLKISSWKMKIPWGVIFKLLLSSHASINFFEKLFKTLESRGDSQLWSKIKIFMYFSHRSVPFLCAPKTILKNRMNVCIAGKIFSYDSPNSSRYKNFSFFWSPPLVPIHRSIHDKRWTRKYHW